MQRFSTGAQPNLDDLSQRLYELERGRTQATQPAPAEWTDATPRHVTATSRACHAVLTRSPGGLGATSAPGPTAWQPLVFVDLDDRVPKRPVYDGTLQRRCGAERLPSSPPATAHARACMCSRPLVCRLRCVRKRVCRLARRGGARATALEAHTAERCDATVRCDRHAALGGRPVPQ